MRSRIVWGLCAAALAGTATAADWPGWLGSTRTAVGEEEGLVEKFPDGGPKVLWRKPVGSGYAGPAVAGGKVYFMDRDLKEPVPMGKAALGTLQGTERIRCWDLKTGVEVWQHEYDCPYTGISYPEGPRTTPVIADGKVYTLGTMGDMLCLDAAAGKVLWTTRLAKDLGVKPPVWGYSAHLLLDGDKLITLVGGKSDETGAVRAFDRKTGKELWKALYSQEVGYSPPVIVEAGGQRQLIVWLSDLIAGLNPETGAVYWRLKHPDLPKGRKQMRPAVTIVTPTVADNTVFISTAYEGLCAIKLETEKPGAAIAWKAKESFPKEAEILPTLMTTLLYRDGHVYGIDTQGKVRCVEAATGKQLWEDASLFQNKDTLFGTAFWVWNGDRVYAVTDLGDLVVCKLTPKGYQELARAHIIDATFSTRGRKVVWCHPAFAEKCVVTRNDKEMVCVSLAQ
jgi:outer membrane protein assembly factor BamB